MRAVTGADMLDASARLYIGGIVLRCELDDEGALRREFEHHDAATVNPGSPKSLKTD